MEAETIAAVATSVGEASIGIIRVSGPASEKIARAVFRNFRGKSETVFPARRMLYGKIVDPETEESIDEVLGVFMPAPHSYTCEDVFEFQSHGGPLVLRTVLDAILKCGARLAAPGEFTQRAFLNGRLDLSQAEAVMDIIRAKTDAALKNATNQLAGALTTRISAVRKEVLLLLAGIEAAIDYPEENLDEVAAIDQRFSLGLIVDSINELLETTRRGKIYQEGLRTVIVGRPNVGKSSLLNALLGEERALVTAIPGTTRDSIEEYLNLRGIPLRIVDTAGLRQSEDLIEQLGIQRTRAFMASADLILFLLDASQPFTQQDQEILLNLPAVPVIVVVNKIDLPQVMDSLEWRSLVANFPVVPISAKDHTGMDSLEEAIERLVLQHSANMGESGVVVNSRHGDKLLRAKNAILNAQQALREGLPLECSVIDLREALEALGEITGETVSDEIVREIFANFCLGK